MNAVVKQWVEVLRSGEYRQAQHVLRTVDDRFCCLGVLCDLYAKSHKGSYWIDPQTVDETNNQLKPFIIGDSSRSREFPDEAVLEWAQITEDFAQRLAIMNDDGDSFDKIADKIEERL